MGVETGVSGGLGVAFASAGAGHAIAHRVDAAAALRRGAVMGEHVLMGSGALSFGFPDVFIGNRVANADIHSVLFEGAPFIWGTII